MNTAAKHHHNIRASDKRRQTQRQRQKQILVAFAIAVVGLVGGIMIFSTGTGDVRVPDFTATTLAGETVQLRDYQGQVVMLNFWAT